MKRLIGFILAAAILLTVCSGFAAGAAANTMGYTDKELEADDNAWNPSIQCTIGRTPGTDCYLAQSFVSTANCITGCRLYFRLGDNATFTIQIRDSLKGGNESILFSEDFPVNTGSTTNVTGWWDFDFSRAVATQKGKTYYLVFWCDIYHSYCYIATTKYQANNLVNTSYRMNDDGTEWTVLLKRSMGYELLTDPNAVPQGYPYQDGEDLVLHTAEEYFAFSRHESNTAVTADTTHYTQGYRSLKVTGGAPDGQGAISTVYVDFDHAVDLSAYGYLNLDLYLPAVPQKALTLQITLSDGSGNGRVYSLPLASAVGWQYPAPVLTGGTPLGNGKLTAAKECKLQILGTDAGFWVLYDHIFLSKTPAPTFAQTYYTDEELKNVKVDVSGIEYVGKPESGSTVLPYGDISGDGAVNAGDALLALKAAVKKFSPTGRQFKLGDVDGNNLLNASDALLILKYAVKKITVFPAEQTPEQPTDPTEFHVTTEGLQANTIYAIDSSRFTALTVEKDGVMPHDAARLVTSLQGLINRDLAKNHIALVVSNTDTNTWIPYIQENSTLLKDYQTVRIVSLQNFLEVFKKQLIDCGMVLWDPDAPATANVAETICGLDGYLPVKYWKENNGLYNKLTEMGVPVKQNLVGLFTGKGLIPGTSLLSTGSKKCDPYLWALEKYGSRCSSQYLIYCPDGASSTVGNRIYEEDVHSKSLDYNRSFGYDYGIYRKAFFFDLSPVNFEAPCDDPTQKVGTDTATLKEILLNRYCRASGEFGEVVGFPPWWIKYSAHNGWGNIADTTMEATFTTIASCYNCYMDADGSIPSCSIYCQFPLAESYSCPANHKPVTEQFDENTTYLYLYTGDYDSSGWVLTYMYAAFNDKERGSIPITWSVNPGLAARIPMAFDYFYTHLTDNDYMSASDSGVGYIRPQCLFTDESERTLPDGDKQWIKICKTYFKQFDMDSVGFIIGTLSDKVCRTYNQFAPVGGGTNDNIWQPSVYAGAGYQRIKNGIGNAPVTDSSIADMYNFAVSMRDYHTAGFRTIKYTASQLKQVQTKFLAYAAQKDPDTTYKFVDYKTFFAMQAAAGQGRTVR